MSDHLKTVSEMKTKEHVYKYAYVNKICVRVLTEVSLSKQSGSSVRMVLLLDAAGDELIS